MPEAVETVSPYRSSDEWTAALRSTQGEFKRVAQNYATETSVVNLAQLLGSFTRLGTEVFLKRPKDTPAPLQEQLAANYAVGSDAVLAILLTTQMEEEAPPFTSQETEMLVSSSETLTDKQWQERLKAHFSQAAAIDTVLGDGRLSPEDARHQAILGAAHLARLSQLLFARAPVEYAGKVAWMNQAATLYQEAVSRYQQRLGGLGEGSESQSSETDVTFAEQLQVREQQYWSEFLGVPAEVVPLPSEVTQDVVEKLRNMGMEIRSLPRLNIGTLDDLKRIGTKAFLVRIEQKYPGFRVFESLSISEKYDRPIGRLLNKQYWNMVKDGTLPFPDGYNKGGWLAIETMPKPSSGVSYDDTPLTTKLGFQDRFNVSANSADQAIRRQAAGILTDSGLPNNRTVRMPTPEEWNLLANREGWGKTDSWEWTGIDASSYGGPRRVLVGHFDGGGAAGTRWFPPSDSSDGVGFRIAVVLGT